MCAQGNRALRNTIAIGDGWMPVNYNPRELGAYLDKLRTMCAEAGRDFSKMDITMFRPYERPEVKQTYEEYEAAGLEFDHAPRSADYGILHLVGPRFERVRHRANVSHGLILFLPIQRVGDIGNRDGAHARAEEQDDDQLRPVLPTSSHKK